MVLYGYIPDITHSGHPHTRFKTHTALGSSGIISDTKIYTPILQVKLKGDVIFHLGSTIILAVSAALLWLGGRSEAQVGVSVHCSPQPVLAPVPRAGPDSDE